MRHLEVLDLRIGEHLVHLVDRTGGHTRVVQQLHQFVAAVAGHMLVDFGIQGIAVLGARLVGGKALLRKQLRRLQRFAEAFIDMAARCRDVDVAILGLEHAGRDRRRVIVTGLAGHVLGDGPACGLKVAHRDHGLQQRRRNPLPLPRALPFQKGNQDTHGAMKACAHIGDGDTGPDRSLPRHAGDPHQPAHALRDLVEARSLGVRPVLAEA